MLEKNQFLIYLAENGALTRQIELSTTKMANDLGSSQQTISRKLIELENDGLIARIPSIRGVKILILSKGCAEIKEIYFKLKSVFGEKKSYLCGTVISGLGEGSYYVALEGYKDQFLKKLNYIPFDGTLNVKADYVEFKHFISNQRKIIIDGFKSQNRTFGAITAYLVSIEGINAAIIVPERTSHDKDIIEVISKVKFRSKLNLNDGDLIKINGI